MKAFTVEGVYVVGSEPGHWPCRLAGHQHIADQCRVLLHGFANVGLIALVDEARGYQDSPACDALAKILEQFVTKEQELPAVD